MTEEKSPKCGFRIKWADREVEYYGESVQEVFQDVFEHVKSIPISSAIPIPPSKEQKGEHKTHPLDSQKTPVQGTEYERIARDSGLTKEQVAKVIEFKAAPKYDTRVPFLPNHPKEEEATLLVTYAFQIGLLTDTMDVFSLKESYERPKRLFAS